MKINIKPYRDFPASVCGPCYTNMLQPQLLLVFYSPYNGGKEHPRWMNPTWWMTLRAYLGVCYVTVLIDWGGEFLNRYSYYKRLWQLNLTNSPYLFESNSASINSKMENNSLKGWPFIVFMAGVGNPQIPQTMFNVCNPYATTCFYNFVSHGIPFMTPPSSYTKVVRLLSIHSSHQNSD